MSMSIENINTPYQATFNVECSMKYRTILDERAISVNESTKEVFIKWICQCNLHAGQTTFYRKL